MTNMKMGKGHSLQELQKRLQGNTPALIALSFPFAETVEEKVGLIEDAIDFITRRMVMSRQNYRENDQDENSLNGSVVEGLVCMGFRASHDTQFGGHCDIVLEASDGFVWMAESKKHSSFKWLLKGFKQLTTRYMTGLPGQSCADLLIFHYGKESDKMIATWHDRLKYEFPNDEFVRCVKDPIAFRSIHRHSSTGISIKIRHKAIPLYFNPEA